MSWYFYPALQGGSYTFGNPTLEGVLDTTPDQFTLGADKLDATVGQSIVRQFVLTGISAGEDVTVNATGNAQVSDGGAFGNSVTVQLNAVISVRLTAGAAGLVVSGGAECNGISDSFSVVAVASQPSIPTRKPRTRNVNVRSLAIALDGPERPYDVYRFSGNVRFFEKPGHNPFDDE